MKILFLMSVLAFSLFAQSLDEVIDYALKHSTVVRQSVAQRDLADLSHQKSRAERFGELDVVGSYTHYNLPRTLAPLTPSAIQSGVPVTTTKDLYSAGLAYSVPLFTGFAQTRSVEMEQLAKEMADAKLKLTKEQLIYNIRSLYLTILTLEERLDAQRAYTKALEQLSHQIAYEVELGKKAKVDLLKSDASLQGSRTQEEMIVANIEIMRASLSALTGMQIKRLSPVSISMKASVPSLQELVGQMPDLKKLQVERLAQHKAQKMVSKSKAAYYPQIALSAYLGKNYGEDLKLNDWDDEVLWQAGLNLKYDLLDFGKRSIAVQKAKIAKFQSALHKEQTELQMKKEFAEALAKIRQNRALYHGNLATKRLSEQSEKIEQARYDHGASTLNDLLLAKSKREQAVAQVIESRYNYQKSLYYLDYLLERGLKHEDQ